MSRGHNGVRYDKTHDFNEPLYQEILTFFGTHKQQHLEKKKKPFSKKPIGN